MATTARGFKSRVLIDREATFNTTPSPAAAKLMQFNTISLSAAQPDNSAATIRGNRSPQKPFRGNNSVSGDIVIPIDSINMGEWLRAMFGAPSSSTNADTKSILVGGKGATSAVATWQAVTSGSVAISISGTAVQVDGISFAAVSSLASCATCVQVAIRAANSGTAWTSATVTLTTAGGSCYFSLESGLSGPGSVIGAATVATGGTDIGGAGFLLWTSALMQSNTDGITDWAHEFKISDDQPSLTIEKGFTDLGYYELMNGCKVSNFACSFGGDGELTATLGFIGGTAAFASASYDLAPTTVSFNRLNNFQASLKLSGTAVATVTTGDFAINFGLEPEYCVGGNGDVTEINEGFAAPTGNITTLFKDLSNLNRAKDGTEVALAIKFGTVQNASVEFFFDEIVMGRTSPNIEGPAGIKVSSPWIAYYDDDADASAVRVVLHNTTASYA